MTAIPISIIPARGGSKAIRRKNLVDLGGKPLIGWTIDAALEAGTRAIVSSEDDEILAAAAKLGAETIRRPPRLATDDVHAVHVVLDALRGLEANGDPADLVLMLLPTSPFRKAEHIRSAIDLFLDKHPPSVISVQEMDKQIIHLREIDEDGVLAPLADWSVLTAQRQEQSPLFGLNGSIYVSQAQQLLQMGTFHVPGALATIMPASASVDINEPADLAYAKYLLGRQGQ